MCEKCANDRVRLEQELDFSARRGLFRGVGVEQTDAYSTRDQGATHVLAIHADDALRSEALRLEERFCGLAAAGARRRVDPGQLCQVLPIVSLSGGDRAAGCHQQDLELRDLARCQIRIGLARMIVKAGVEAAVANAGQDLLRGAVFESNLHSRLPFRHDGEQLSDHFVVRVAACSETEPAHELSCAPRSLRHQFLMSGERLLRFEEETLPVGRQAHASRSALEEAESKDLFDGLDVRAHGRLAQMQELGGARNAALTSDDNEGFQLINVHGCLLALGEASASIESVRTRTCSVLGPMPWVLAGALLAGSCGGSTSAHPHTTGGVGATGAGGSGAALAVGGGGTDAGASGKGQAPAGGDSSFGAADAAGTSSTGGQSGGEGGAGESPGVAGEGGAPVQIGSVGQIEAGGSHTCALSTSGSITCWGSDGSGEAQAPPGGGFKQLALGQNYSCALRDDATVTCWGNDGDNRFEIVMQVGATTLDATRRAICAVLEGGLADCWGDNIANIFDQVDEPPLTAVGASLLRVCGLTELGGISCWGVAVTLPSADDYVALSVGEFTVCGLHRDGTLSCGYDRDGIEAPPPYSDFVQVSAGAEYVCALRVSGKVVCWGLDALGEAQAPEEADFTWVSAGKYHTCALRTDGKAVCWGSNSAGQLEPIGDFKP